MSEFLTRLSSFLNLQKAATISVPGLLMALAILLIYYSNPPQILKIPAPSSDPTEAAQLKIPQVCLDLAAEQSLTSGSGRVNELDYKTLQARRQNIDKCVRQLQSGVVADQSKSAALAAQMDVDQKAVDDLMKQYREYELKGMDLAARYRSLAQDRLAALQANKLLSKQADAHAQIYTDLIARYNAEYKVLSDRVHAGEDQEPFADFVSKLSDKLMYVILVGIILGLILDPINKIIQSALYTDGRIRRLNQSHDNWKAVPTRAMQNAYPSATTAKAAGVDPEEVLRMKCSNVNYAIGTGLMTQADLDSLLDRYGLSSQFGFGLILPMAALILGGGLFVQHRVIDAHAAPPGTPAVTQPAGGSRG